MRSLDSDKAVSNTNLVEASDLDMCSELSANPHWKETIVRSSVDDMQGLPYGSTGR
jgi:hypothetical protein